MTQEKKATRRGNSGAERHRWWNWETPPQEPASAGLLSMQRGEQLEQDHIRGSGERAALAKQALTHQWLLLSSFNQVRIHYKHKATPASSEVPHFITERKRKGRNTYHLVSHSLLCSPPTFAPDDGGGEIKGNCEQFRVSPLKNRPVWGCGFQKEPKTAQQASLLCLALLWAS